jgi:riboflavin synthase
LRDVRPGPESSRLSLVAGSPFRDFVLGESIAVNGVCLTVDFCGDGFFQADVSPTTLEATTLGRLAPGVKVNLERALRLGDRLGGHLVSGHVDGVGSIVAREQRGNAIVFKVQPPTQLLRYLVPKGSVALEGISLTVNEVDQRCFSLTIIPHSLRKTTLQWLKAGDRVNIETDILAKYVERLVQGGNTAGEGPINLEFLAKNGYL